MPRQISEKKLKLIPKGKTACTKCGKEYSNVHFGWVKRGENGDYSINTKVCKTCVNKNSSLVYHLRKIYLPPTDSKCYNCRKVTKRLNLDHDYKTGHFRGYLCGECNTGIGKLGDNKAGLIRALKYLEKAKVRKKIKIKRINLSKHNSKIKK